MLILRLNSRVVNNMRIDAFNNVVYNSVSFYSQNETGVLTSALTNDIQELYDTGNNFAFIVANLIKLFALIIILFFFSPILTVISLLLFPTFFIVGFLLRKYQRRVEKEWRRNFGQVNQRFSENMRAITISKAFGREQTNIAQFVQTNEATYKSSVKRAVGIFIIGPINDFMRNLSLILILMVGSFQVSTGNLSLDTFYLFVFLIDFFHEPAAGLARNYTRFQSVFATIERVRNLIDDKNKENLELGVDLPEFVDEPILVDHVDFEYEKGKRILNDVSFKINPNKKVALVGHTGAGKSTLAHLLMRFYEPTHGEIIIGANSFLEYKLQSLRQNFGLVSQSLFLFKGTLRDNLRFVNPTATDKVIWEVLEVVQAKEFIEELAEGLDSIVAEGGKNLSAGQRQMISFARVLLTKPEVIILDEATSSVDLYTESKIQQATDSLLSDRTAVVIAHRLTTILNSDLIVVIEKGRVLETGSHNELLERNGVYAELYQLYFQSQSAKYLDKIKTTR